MIPKFSSGGQERRRAHRLPVTLAVEMSSAEKTGRAGITRNVSARGLLIATRSRFGIGERLQLAVHGRSGIMGGRVVRVEEVGRDSPEIWRYRLAVELDGPLPDELLEPTPSK